MPPPDPVHPAPSSDHPAKPERSTETPATGDSPKTTDARTATNAPTTNERAATDAAPQLPGVLSRFQGFPVDSVFAQPRPLTSSLTRAVWFALAAGLCLGILYSSYSFFRAPGISWAVISAILVLIPDAKQSIATALARVAANVIGAIAGLLIAKTIGEGSVAIIIAITLVTFVCFLARLDAGLRTACVGTVIVMTTYPGDIDFSSLSRFVAVIIGCAVGVGVQLLVLLLQRTTTRPTTTPESQNPEGSVN